MQQKPNSNNAVDASLAWPAPTAFLPADSKRNAYGIFTILP